MGKVAIYQRAGVPEYVIIDSTAGERERGSLEPLLINPVARWEFVVGKLLAFGRQGQPERIPSDVNQALRDVMLEPGTLALIRKNQLQKGDVLAVARVAGMPRRPTHQPDGAPPLVQPDPAGPFRRSDSS